MLDIDMKTIARDIYGKVISVRQNDASYETTVRFTSIPKAGYQQLRKSLDLEGPA